MLLDLLIPVRNDRLGADNERGDRLFRLYRGTNGKADVLWGVGKNEPESLHSLSQAHFCVKKLK